MAFPIDIQYIIAAEQELGLLFPESFKNKMLQENGGMLVTQDDDWQLFPFFDQSDKKRIRRTCNHILAETRYMKNGWTGFPSEGVAIAANGSGDCLLLLPNPQDKTTLGDQIFVWQHETGTIEQVANHIDELTEK